MASPLSWWNTIRLLLESVFSGLLLFFSEINALYSLLQSEINFVLHLAHEFHIEILSPGPQMPGDLSPQCWSLGSEVESGKEGHESFFLGHPSQRPLGIPDRSGTPSWVSEGKQDL